MRGRGSLHHRSSPVSTVQCHVICPTCPLVLPVYVDVLNRVMLVCGGHTHDCSNYDVDGCSVHVCAECGCDGGDMCCGVVVDRAVVTTLAGSGAASFADGSGTNARFHYPYGVAVDASGNVFVGDHANHCIRKVTAGGGTRIGPVTLHARVAESCRNAGVGGRGSLYHRSPLPFPYYVICLTLRSFSLSTWMC